MDAQETWIAAVSFAEDYYVPDHARDLIFYALSDSSVKMNLETEDGKVFNCVVYDILELPDTGVVEIASPNLGGAKITFVFNS